MERSYFIPLTWLCDPCVLSGEKGVPWKSIAQSVQKNEFNWTGSDSICVSSPPISAI